MRRNIFVLMLSLLVGVVEIHAKTPSAKWVVRDAVGKVVGNIEIPADPFVAGVISSPGAFPDEENEEMRPVYLGNWLDDRQNITGTGRKLEKAAVVIEESYEGYYLSMCSGAMVGPNLVLTAAHCLVHQDQRPVRVVAAGMPKTKKGHPTAKVIRTIVPQEYAGIYYTKPEKLKDLEGEEADYDYGFIVLDQNLGSKTGYFGVSAAFESRYLAGSPIYVLGWHGDKSDRTLWRSPGKVIIEDDYFFYFDACTHDGNSGAPIVLQERPSYIIGLNIAGDDYSVDSLALPITADIVQLVREYRKAAPQQPAKKKKKKHSV